MAQRSSASKPNKGSGKSGSKPAKRQLGKQPEKSTILDERTKRDIAAVSLGILGVVFFAMAFMNPDGVVSGALAMGMRYCFGIGVYVLPFLLIMLAITLLIRFERQRVPARVAIGFALLYVAFLGIASLFVAGSDTNPNVVFEPMNLLTHGGYLGGGIAWAGLELFGFTISMILMVGLVVISAIIIGFSLSSIIERIRNHGSADGEGENGFEGMQRFPSARIRKAPRVPHGQPEQDALGQATLPTQALDPASSKKASLAAQNTQLLGDGASSAQKPKKRASSRMRDLSAENTIAFGADSEPAKQITRKLGSRPEPKAAEAEKPAAAPKKKATDVAIPKPLEGFELPDMSLLNSSNGAASNRESEASLRSTGMLLQETLADFGVNAEVVGWAPGPTVTLFKIDLPSGVRVNRVTNLTDDIALALAAPGVRIFSPVPGTNYVGIEVPNKQRETVLLGDVLKDAPKKGPLQIAIGKDVEGENIVSDLAKMPHLLIGGTTGSGKSVAINGMIMSILMRATPAEVRMIMIDPKRVEFTPYNGIPHLYVPVVTEPREAASALSWAVAEMERRLKVFSGVGARNIGQYNAKVQKGLEINDAPASEMPYIVIIIDELADLMMNVGKEVEFSISRLAQLARAAGIHLIVATQRPSTNVVTGLIKANITNRIAFNVASGIDSRVILDTPGAENLIGLGDMLLSKPELAKPQRIQGCFVSEDEISAVVEKLKSQGEPEYHNDILKTNLITLGDSMPDGSGGTSSGPDDPLVWEAAELVVSSGMGSTSSIQRRLSVGYSRAGRLMDLLEEKGIVGPPNGSKPREVLIDDPLELETLKAFEQNDSQ